MEHCLSIIAASYFILNDHRQPSSTPHMTSLLKLLLFQKPVYLFEENLTTVVVVFVDCFYYYCCFCCCFRNSYICQSRKLPTVIVVRQRSFGPAQASNSVSQKNWIFLFLSLISNFNVLIDVLVRLNFQVISLDLYFLWNYCETWNLLCAIWRQVS